MQIKNKYKKKRKHKQITNKVINSSKSKLRTLTYSFNSFLHNIPVIHFLH